VNLSFMGLNAANAAIAKRPFPDFDARDTGANQIEALMNAARAEGMASVGGGYSRQAHADSEAAMERLSRLNSNIDMGG
jgi:hypothetical protein